MEDWVIAGKPDGTMPEVGKTYEIRHSRKGTFTGKILEIRGEFATVEIVEGKVHFASVENNLFNPDPEVISIRSSMSYLIERD